MMGLVSVTIIHNMTNGSRFEDYRFENTLEMLSISFTLAWKELVNNQTETGIQTNRNQTNKQININNIK